MSEYLTYGLHPVEALLKNPKRQIYKIYVSVERSDKRIDGILKLAKDQGVAVHTIKNAEFKQRFGDIPHQGVVAEAAPPKSYQEADLKNIIESCHTKPLILILDGITDPHNLGACLRSADAAGVSCVITPKDNSADITPLVCKIASGAAESVPFVRVTNLARTIKMLQEEGVWVYGAAGEASQSIYNINFSGPAAIVMGAEGKGLRRLTRELCDELFALPMHGTVSSLNVSVATGISLFEVMRQRTLA